MGEAMRPPAEMQDHTARPRRVDIRGLPITHAKDDAVLAEIARVISSGSVGHYVCVTNTESMYLGLDLPEHGDYIRAADMALCDGVGVAIAGWAYGYRLSRFAGPDLQLACAREGLARGWRHFLYGGKDGIADALARKLARDYPGIVICGTYCPPFRPLTEAEDEAAVAMINAAKPDIVWVGLGLPKQERWIAAHRLRIAVPWMIGVGAAFDYHTGAVQRAPKFMQRMGLEWLYCFAIQPRLRARRYWRAARFVISTIAVGSLQTVITCPLVHPLFCYSRSLKTRGRR